MGQQPTRVGRRWRPSLPLFVWTPGQWTGLSGARGVPGLLAPGPCRGPWGTGSLARGGGAGGTPSAALTPTRHPAHSRRNPLVLSFPFCLETHPGFVGSYELRASHVEPVGGPGAEWAWWGDHGWLSAVTSCHLVHPARRLWLFHHFTIEETQGQSAGSGPRPQGQEPEDGASVPCASHPARACFCMGPQLHALESQAQVVGVPAGRGPIGGLRLGRCHPQCWPC